MATKGNGRFSISTSAPSNFEIQLCIPMHLEKNRLLFLDFDGVLHPTSAARDKLFGRIPLLSRALCDLECNIVISSSWRHHYEAEQLLGYFPEPLSSRIVGFTGEAHIGKLPRYQEIQNYLKMHGQSDWQALDDSFIEFPKGCPQLLLCNPNVGIDEQHIVAIQRWLQE